MIIRTQSVKIESEDWKVAKGNGKERKAEKEKPNEEGQVHLSLFCLFLPKLQVPVSFSFPFRFGLFFFSFFFGSSHHSTRSFIEMILIGLIWLKQPFQPRKIRGKNEERERK